MQNVWEYLVYDNIFSAVEKTIGKKLSNICIPRNSYINRVFELEEYDSRERIIVKFYRPNRWTPEMIIEEHSFVKELYLKEIPVIPPLEFDGKSLFMFENIPYAIFSKKGGRSIDEFDDEGWKGVGRLLGRIHLISENYPGSNRVIWKPKVATANHVETLINTNTIPPDFQKTFTDTAQLFIDFAEPQFVGRESLLLHGDCHRGNLIHRPNEGVFLVDFDDMSVGVPVQDLWMLLPDEASKCKKELQWFFDGYQTFKPFDRTSLELIPVLRGMRLIHFASWCAIQKDEPNFEKHFPDWGSTKYWNELIKDLQSIVYAEE